MSFYPKPEDQATDVYVHPCPVRASAGTLQLLDRLHAMSTEQEEAIDKAEVEKVGFDNYMRDKFIALDQDKCWFVYQTCLAIGARNVVEVNVSSAGGPRADILLIGRHELWRQYDLPSSGCPADHQDTRWGSNGHCYGE